MVKRGLGLIVLVVGLLVGSVVQAFARVDDDAFLDGGVPDALLLNLIGTVGGDDTFSTIDLLPVIQPTDPGTGRFGPFKTASNDHGTCLQDQSNPSSGIVWAHDIVNRFFVVRSFNGTSTPIVEQFRDGVFQTVGAPSTVSPGSCDTSNAYGGRPPSGTVNGGIGYADTNFHGYAMITVFGPARFTGTGSCTGNCTAGAFIDQNFSVPPAPPPSAIGQCAPTGPFVNCFQLNAWFFHYNVSNPQNYGLVSNDWKNASCNRGGSVGDIRNATTGTSLVASC